MRGLSFAVERGEVFGLLGPNGAGKTTTVEILEGYRRRSGGEVSVLGQDPESRDRRLQERVGIVLQSCGFYPRATVREAVEHFSKAYPRRATRPRRSRSSAWTRRPTRARRTLSGGQRRRLDLALALVGDPELVFLDEPTTGFDPAARRAAWGVVRRAEGAGQDGGAHHPLPGRGAGAGGPRGDREGRAASWRRARPTQLGPAAPRYRVSYLSEGRRVECQTDDPTELLHRLTRDALARGERLEGLEVARPTLEEVYLELTHEADSVMSAACALAWEQFRFERSMFWRNPSAAFFNFLLPLLLLVLIASAFAGDDDELEVLVPGVAGMGVLATTFTALAFNLTLLREEGVLKRIRGTPMPAGAYLAGLIGSAALNALVQVALVVVIGNVAYGVALPVDPLAAGPVHGARGGVLRVARDRVLARDPERGRRARVHQRRLPAADLHLGRLLLVRRAARGAARRWRKCCR